MRQSGATLEQLGSRFGITREGVRQLLTRHYGSTRIHELLTTIELRRLAGCTWKYIKKLRLRGVIQPAKVIGHAEALWHRETVAAVIEYIDRLRCPVCHQPVPSNRRGYCSRQCYLEARRYKNQPEEAKRRHDKSVARWIAEHPEKAGQIRQRAEAEQQAKRSLQRYRTTQCVIWRKCLIPLGTVVRVVSGNKGNGRVKVEWGEQIVEIPFACVRRMEKEAVTIE
ncbi:hypothetical protein ES708_23658 [subsurface metagenome]